MPVNKVCGFYHLLHAPPLSHTTVNNQKYALLTCSVFGLTAVDLISTFCIKIHFHKTLACLMCVLAKRKLC